MTPIFFKVLESAVSLDGPEESVAPIAAAHRRFQMDEVGPTRSVPIRMATDGAGWTIQVGDRHEIVPVGVDATLMLYQAFLFALMDGVAGRIVLHSAALAHPSGGGVLIAGPSGYGKSSLTMELISRGYRFLSDDYAPLDPETGRVTPHPRAIGVLPRGEAPIPEPFRSGADASNVMRLFGKSLVDVGDVYGDQAIADKEIEIRTVVLLGSEEESPTTTIEFGARLEDTDQIAEALGIPGVAVIETADRGEVRIWRLEVDPRANPTLQLSALLESKQVLFSEKHWEGSRRFLDQPVGAEIGVTDAARRLSREILNRRKRGALMKRIGGHLPMLFLELAGGLRRARCYQLHPGPFRVTADWIDERCGETAQ